jgi:hypothetical protein
VAACVSGELHEIGVRMLCDLLEMEGWNTIYLGANVPTAGSTIRWLVPGSVVVSAQDDGSLKLKPDRKASTGRYERKFIG